MSPDPTPGWLKFLLKRFPRWKSWFWGFLAGSGLSLALQSLTSGALWFPREWRFGITFLVGLAVTAITHGLDDVIGKLRSRAQNRALFTAGQIVLMLVFLGLAFAGLNTTYSNRAEYVWHLNQRDNWWIEQFGTTTDKSTGALVVVQHRLPDFIDFENRTIFLPSRFDPAMTSYLLQIGRDRVAIELSAAELLRHGIEDVLAKEPMRLIDWSQGAGMNYRREATQKMFWTHLFLMGCIAVAWGLLPKSERPAELSTLLDLFKPKPRS